METDDKPFDPDLALRLSRLVHDLQDEAGNRTRHDIGIHLAQAVHEHVAGVAAEREARGEILDGVLSRWREIYGEGRDPGWITASLHLGDDLSTVKHLLDSHNEFGKPLDPEAELPPVASKLHALLSGYRDLVDRASEHFEAGETAPDETWYRDLFELTGDHMILTEEGWVPGSLKQQYLDQYGIYALRGEVNAPGEG